MDWKEIGTAGGALVAVGLPLAKIVHQALTKSIIDEINKVRADIVQVQRDQRRNDIETRAIGRTQDALSNILIESLASRELARKLTDVKSQIKRDADFKIEQAETEYQEKIEEINKKKTGV